LCQPQPGIFFEQTFKDNKVDDIGTKEVTEDSSSTVEGTASLIGQSSTKSLFRKVMNKIISAAQTFGLKVKKLFQNLGRLLFVIIRCAICVLCNIINIILDLVAFIKDKVVELGVFLKDKGQLVFNKVKGRVMKFKNERGKEKMRRQDAITQGNQELGGYCEDNTHCKSGHCHTSTIMGKGRHECVGSATCPETRPGKCETIGTFNALKSNNKKCLSSGCKLNPNAPKLSFRKCITLPPAEYEDKQKNGCTSPSSDNAFIELGNTMSSFEDATREQRIQRIAHNLHHAGAFEDHEEFAYQHVAQAQTLPLLTNVFSFLQSSAVVQKSKHIHGLAGLPPDLPNGCVNMENFGKSFSIAINYENPSLFEALFAIPFNIKDALPELLVAIAPTVVEGSKVKCECLVMNALSNTTCGVQTQVRKKDGVDFTEEMWGKDVVEGIENKIGEQLLNLEKDDPQYDDAGNAVNTGGETLPEGIEDKIDKQILNFKEDDTQVNDDAGNAGNTGGETLPACEVASCEPLQQDQCFSVPPCTWQAAPKATGMIKGIINYVIPPKGKCTC